MKMRQRRLCPLLLLTGSVALMSGAQAGAEVPADWGARSGQLADQLMGELRAELEAAMKSGGPMAAIDVCKSRAPAIAARLSRSSGAEVGRTALRVRNPLNAPGSEEQAVMERFVRELAEKPTAPPTPPPSALIESPNPQQGGLDRVYMRAIVMQPQCLPCHGAALAPEVAEAVRKNYPEDQATGFEPGQLRGAVVVRWKSLP